MIIRRYSLPFFRHHDNDSMVDSCADRTKLFEVDDSGNSEVPILIVFDSVLLILPVGKNILNPKTWKNIFSSSMFDRNVLIVLVVLLVLIVFF